MQVRFEFCLEGPRLEIDYVDENTIKINGEDYYFDPIFAEYENTTDPLTGIIAIYNAYRDESGELYTTLYQGYSDKSEIDPIFIDGAYHDPCAGKD